MSPLSTLNNCGNSSMRSLRITRPTRVTRLSPAVAQRGMPSFSASVRMLRNFTTLNGLLFRPTRSCLYSTGPELSSLMMSAVTSMIGKASRISTTAPAMSNRRLMLVRRKPWSKPSPKMSQPADTASRRI
ncbi:hypothetical protein D9M69_647420 [compost metagenome]